MKRSVIALLLSVAAFSTAHADAVDDKVRGLQRSWEHINYEIAPSTRASEMIKLAAQADALVAQSPGRAEPLVWDAIITSTAAGLKGGLGALGMAKDAKAMLEKAEAINPTVLEGSVYSSLGSLYAQVPGAPLGFGDKVKARTYLQKAVAINPNGIDPNFFMGDYLIRQKDYANAVKYLDKAVAAPPRPGREVADRGRRAEAQALIAQAKAKMN